MRYNFQVATGKSATPFDADIKFIENPDEGELPVELPDPEDEYLNYDREHRLVSTLTYSTERNSGPEILGMRPLSNLSVNLRYTYQTGRPYSYGSGLKFNKRTPGYHNMLLRLQKTFGKPGFRYTLFVEVNNLLNKRDYAYTLFNNVNAVTRWETYYDDDETNDIGDPMIFYDWDPLVYRQELIFIKNSPRHFRLGLKMNL
jgi:hypothetical protein